ncbi:hypothetical protein NDU88_001606 [Pleurodeles waltl]|uniref:Uncharacterized protein n=1 Tax=Pleurodeles waltl TaxID=8319 RepID=A0AAV7PBQ5_PLEWA|nr:hypothetical protein NDU88_001606 [Pleurodeles waltl]
MSCAQSKRLFHRRWPGNSRLSVLGMLAHAFTSTIRLARSGVVAAGLPSPLLQAQLPTTETPAMLGCDPLGLPRGLPAPRSTDAVRGQLGPLIRALVSGPKVSIRFTAADSQVWARYLCHCFRPGYLVGPLFSVPSLAQSLLFSIWRALRDLSLSAPQVPVAALSLSLSEADAVLQAAFCVWGPRQASV